MVGGLQRDIVRGCEVSHPRNAQGLAVLQRSIGDIVSAPTGVEWAVSIRDTAGREVLCRNGDRAMKTASVGKLLLLIEVARQRDAGELSGTALLRRRPELVVADSGLWRHLRVDQLAVDDLCVLTASVSDNTATNVLLDTVGLARVGALSRTLGLAHTVLLDYVRDHRGPDQPPTLSTGSATELSRLMSRLSSGDVVSPAVSQQVITWLATGVDLSLAASAFGLDPLVHTPGDGGIAMHNKTGADPGVRADVGTVGRNDTRFSYAVIANWQAARAELKDVVLSGMNGIGACLRALLDGGG